MEAQKCTSSPFPRFLWSLVFLFVSTSSTVSLHCPKDTLFHSGFCFRAVIQEAPFALAREACQAQGGSLAIFRSHAAQRAVFQWLREKDQMLSARSYWIGLKYDYMNGDRTWRYVDGNVLTPWDYQDWSTSNITERRNLCALVTNNRWLADGCREGKYPYLCYYQAHYCDVHNVHVRDGFVTECRDDGQFLHGDIVSISCRDSYTLIGPINITCLSNGSWSSVPTCEAGCRRPNATAKSFTAMDKAWHRVGDTRVLFCDDGYIVIVDGIPRTHVVLTCIQSGKWTPEKVACIPVNSTLYSFSPESVAKVSVPPEGTTVLNCPEVTLATVEGTPVAPVWLKDQVEVNLVANTRTRFRNEPQNILSLENVDVGATGIYMCLVEDGNGELHVSAFHVTVSEGEECLMELLVKPKDVAKFEKNHALLRCFAMNSHNVWFKDGQRIDSGGRIRILPDGSLLLQHVCYEDGGDYTCTATKRNSFCSMNATAKLSVAPTTRTLCGLIAKEIAENEQEPIKSTKGAAISDHPWLATLWLRDSELPFCYGTLLSERWVVTSTTCVINIKKYRFLSLIVKLGMMGPSEDSNDTLHVYRVGHIETHPQYLWSNTENDVAMLWLNREVVFTDSVRPLCLKPAEKHEDPCYREGDVHGQVSGWGSFDTHVTSQGLFLRAESLVTEEQDLCQRSVNFRLPPSLFCARSETGDRDHKHFAGDSGSPFAVMKGGRWYLHGIFTRGERYTHDGDYDYFTRTEQHMEWIAPFLQKH